MWPGGRPELQTPVPGSEESRGFRGSAVLPSPAGTAVDWTRSRPEVVRQGLRDAEDHQSSHLAAWLWRREGISRGEHAHPTNPAGPFVLG